MSLILGVGANFLLRRLYKDGVINVSALRRTHPYLRLGCVRLIASITLRVIIYGATDLYRRRVNSIEQTVTKV